MDNDKLDQLRFHPAWKAALRHVKEQILPLNPPKDILGSTWARSGWRSGQHMCLDVIDAEINKTES